MTGRRLYDHYCDAHVNEYTRDRWDYQERRNVLRKPLASWPYLSDAEKRVYNDLARRIAPRRTKA